VAAATHDNSNTRWLQLTTAASQVGSKMRAQQQNEGAAATWGGNSTRQQQTQWQQHEI